MTSSRLRLPAFLVAAFLIVHGFYFLAGVRFIMRPLEIYWQYLDPVLLQTRLAESLFYLHCQPPGFNLFLGLVLKLFPGHAAGVFHASFLASGLVLYAALFLLMRRLGVSTILSALLATLFMASPSFVLYEHLLFYDFPVASLLVLAALALHRFLEGGRTSQGLAFFSCLLALCAIRSLFHVAYFALIFILLFLFFPALRRPLLKAAVVPFLLVLALYLKNLYLFDTFSTSSWIGMNFARITLHNLPEEELRRLAGTGGISEVAAIPPFSEVDLYPARFLENPRFPGIVALSQKWKSTGRSNFNHEAYLAISRQYLEDEKRIVAREPGIFILGVAKSFFFYFKPTTDHFAFDNNRTPLVRSLISLSDYLVSGKVPLPVHYKKVEDFFYLFLLAGLPLVFVHGLSLALKAPSDGSPARRAVLFFLCGNIAFVALTVNLLEFGENNRIRFMTDPLSLVLLGLLLERALRSRGLSRFPSVQ